jgi:hypothetical protein
MLTIFTVPKAFRDHTGIIQTNAIHSWLMLRPQPEIILFGNDEGTTSTASQLGIRHVPDVQCNEYGTPLLNSIFKTAQDIASNPLICYVNADIILLSDFMPAIRQIHMPSFLLVGQRWDLDLAEAIDFDNPVWEKELRARLAEKGQLHPPTGIDYFVFPRNMYAEIPAFAIGRTTWDNWLIYRTRFLGIPVIDATEIVVAIHQNHGYKPLPHSVEGPWKGPESTRNLELAGGLTHAFTLLDANRVFTPQGLKRPKPTITRLLRYIDTLPVLHPRLRFVAECLRLLVNLARLARASYRKVTKFIGKNNGNEEPEIPHSQH